MPQSTNQTSRARHKKQTAGRKQKSSTNKKKRQKMPLWKKVFLAVFLLVLAAGLSGVGLFAYYASAAPDMDPEALVGTEASVILDPEGNVLYELGGDNADLELIQAEDIPQVLQDAVVSIEDQRFFEHNGVDPIRIAGALFANLQSGGISQGGSTITQQLIKLSYFSTTEEDQTIERKAQEAWMSIQLEREYTKEEILAMYMNKVYMSNNVYGMAAAAQYYFGKELADITLAEAATLAGMPQAPSAYDPYVNAESATTRRNLVLDAMVDNGVITQAESNEAKTTDLAASLVDHTGEESNELVIDAFLQIVIDEVKEKTGLDVTAGGLTIQTTIDMDAQQHLYDVVNSDEYIAFPDDDIQTAATLTDVNTGAIKAVIGNRKTDAQMANNFATTTTRSVGSTIKPLIDYAPAIEYLDYSTGTLIVDEEYQYASGQELYNYDFEYKGDMTLREALTDSRNVPAAKLLQEVGYENADAFLEKLGISSINEDDAIYESSALNGNISVVDLSAAYAAFANGGTYYEPYTVISVADAEGTVYTHEAAGETAMKDSTAYMVTDMLKDVITASATQADIDGLYHAGKTGTTNYTEEELAQLGLDSQANVGKDAWFVGYTPNYSLSVWLGYEYFLEQGHYLDYDTRNITRYIYKEMMSYVSQDVPNEDWEKPASVSEVEIEKYTDPIAKPGPNTPSDLITTELFVKGTEPSSVSTKYGATLAAPTGLKASYNEANDQLNISWNEYKVSGMNATTQYTVTVGGTQSNTTSTSLSVDNPPKGNVSIQLQAKVGSSTSPAATISIQIADSEEESSATEVEDKEDEGDSSSSSSSSESSSSQPASEAAESPAEEEEEPSSSSPESEPQESETEEGSSAEDDADADASENNNE